MPIRLRLSLAVAALALAACSYGANSTSPLVTPSPSPVPTGTATTITVRYQGNLQFNQPVQLWTNGGTTAAPTPLGGTLIATKNTDPSTVSTGGQVMFSGLTPATIYCWVATVPSSPPPQTATLTVCTDTWQNGFTLGS